MESSINLTHLRYFYDAVANGSISAAARENFVSQSAISQGIFKLEQALKVVLTTHQKQGIQLTEEGSIVYNEAKKIFCAVDALKDKLNDLNNEVSGTVVFACTNSIAQFYVVQHYNTIKKQYPRLKLKFHRGGMKFIHSALKEEHTSFAIAVNGKEFEAYDKEVLKTGYFRLFKTKDVPFEERIFIDHCEYEEVKELRYRYVNKYKKELVIQEELSGWTMVEKFVQNGCGAGFLPDFIMSENDSIEEVKLKIPPIRYEICVFKLKGRLLSRAARAVIELIKDH